MSMYRQGKNWGGGGGGGRGWEGGGSKIVEENKTKGKEKIKNFTCIKNCTQKQQQQKTLQTWGTQKASCTLPGKRSAKQNQHSEKDQQNKTSIAKQLLKDPPPKSRHSTTEQGLVGCWFPW